MESFTPGMENQVVSSKKMNVFQRAVGVIVSPAETMKNLIEKPRVLFPILLMAVSALLMILVNFEQYKEFLSQTTQATYERMNIEMTPEQLDASLQFGAIAALVTTPITVVVAWFIESVIIFAAFKILKGEGKLKQFLSIIGYSSVITVFNYITLTIVSQLTGSFNMQAPVTSLASLLPASLAGTFLAGALSMVELFTIWKYAVISIGLGELSGLSKKKVYIILGVILLIYAVYTGVSMSMAYSMLG
jgi:hypothetical protein